MQLLHVANSQVDALNFIDLLLSGLGIAPGHGETLGNGLIRVTLDTAKPTHIVKDHCKFPLDVRNPSGFTLYRRLVTEVLAQLGYRHHSISFEDGHIIVFGIKPLRDCNETVQLSTHHVLELEDTAVLNRS